jgi:hypothetical protein
VIDATDCAESRISLGVYVPGALEPGERAVVDRVRGSLSACGMTGGIREELTF